MASRELTYDEKKAAEAAFRGLPLNPKWSAAARDVYEGIVHATQGKEAVHPLLPDLEEVPISSSSPEASRELTVQEAQEEERPVQLLNRQEAIEAGILVDVSPIAETVGLRLSVGISRPLWELGISASRQLADDECQGRVRDILLALRLYIEQNEVKGPWIKFTALLALPPEAAPQLCSLVAIAHRDPTAPHSLTL